MLRWAKSHKIASAGYLLLGILVAVVTGALMHHIAPISFGWYQPVDSSGGLAMQGYDPVSYHVAGTPLKGKEANSFEWQGVEWHFASAENMTLFMANPARYAPQFGGHCAMAVSKGTTASTDPEVWHLENEKLYLFFSESPKRDFLRDIQNGIIAKSESRWAGN